MLSECSPSGCDNLFYSFLALFFVLSAVANICSFQRPLSGADICRVQSTRLSSNCASSNIIFHFHQLAPATFVVVHAVY